MYFIVIVYSGFGLYLLILSCQVGFISQVAGAAFGALALLICTVSCLHTLYSLWQKGCKYNDEEKNEINLDFSTLV